MPDPLLMTKVSLPILRQLLVPRLKVLSQLNEGLRHGNLLTLVSAPAGYGKTTTIRMWVEQAGPPVAWVVLDKSDNDLKQFLTYVLTALGQAGIDLGQAALEAVENGREINPPQVLGLLVNDLHDLQHPVILVLEEYNLIENEKIDEFIELILNQALPNLHLVIATREDPNLPLTRLRVRNQLTEIRAADLSFSLGEAAEFFSKVMRINLSEEETKILKDRTEGWVAGLQLAALSLKEISDTAKFVEAFRGTHRHVLDYLIEEVLNSQPPEIREFLQRTSILDQLSVSLCEAVTGQVASRKYLNDLEHNNLFLVALDEERNWFRYHALFAELLKNQLLQIEPERLDDLHNRAADWYERNGVIQKAVEHAFQISSGKKVSELIEKYALPMIYQGEVTTVIEWYDRLQESLMKSSPMLCIGKAWALALMQRRTRRTKEVEEALQAADDALNRTHAEEAFRNLIAGHTASIQVFIWQSPTSTDEEPAKLLEIAQKALRLLPQDEKAIRSVNFMNIGNSYTALMDLPAAEQAYNQALEEGVVGGNYYAAVYGPSNLILLAMAKGQLKSAFELCETNIDRFNRFLAGQRFPPIGAFYILKGCIFLEENRLTEAEEALTHGLSLIHLTGEFRTHLKGYSAMARLRSAQGDQTGVTESLKFLEETRLESAPYVQALSKRFSISDPDQNFINFEEAQLKMTQAIAKFNTLPDITGVNLMSRIRFQTYLSDAHILTRLAARNPQAYSFLEIHNYLARQEKFAHAHDLFDWLIEIWILRALMYHVEGKAEEAYRMTQSALSAAAPRGYFRIFLDEADLMRSLLESIAPRLTDDELSAYVKRLLEAMPGETPKVARKAAHDEILSDRELEVLRLLTDGKSYKEIGERLFLSLNTIQFHIKGIYRKLSVNKRTQAIEKAREMDLI